MVLSVRTRIFLFDSAERRIGFWRAADFRLQNEGGRKALHAGRRSRERRFRCGEIVRQSGIYEVIHDRQHRESHEVVMISGELFPDCETCREKVRFRLIRTAPYIFQDEDFEEDT